MARARIISYQLTRPRHTIRLRTDRNNFYRVDMQKENKKDYCYLGWMTAQQVKTEARQFTKEWHDVRFTKISEKQWQELMAKDGN